MKVQIPYIWLIAASLFAGPAAFAQGWAPSVAEPGQYYAPLDRSQLYSELVPADHGFIFPEDFSKRATLNANELWRGTWGRIEYLQGNISHADATILGTPTLAPGLVNPNIDVIYYDPSQQFPVEMPPPADPSIVPPPVFAEVPSTDNIRWKHAQGIRGSFGVPITNLVSAEGRFWGFEDQNQALHTPRFPPLTIDGSHGTVNSTFLATTLTTDGQIGSAKILYDAGFRSAYRSSIKGGDAALVFNWKNPDQGIRMLPIMGYRHEQYAESLGFGGTFDNRSGYIPDVGIITPRSNWIQSDFHNIRDMMELGLRTEWEKGFLTLGVQERIAFGSNVARGTVWTNNARDPGSLPSVIDDPDVTTSSQRRVTFAPSFDLDVYANIKMNNWLSFRVGYNLMWMGGLAAADRSIQFNEVTNGTGGTDPDIVSRIRYTNRTVSSLTIGGEIVLP